MFVTLRWENFLRSLLHHGRHLRTRALSFSSCSQHRPEGRPWANTWSCGSGCSRITSISCFGYRLPCLHYRTLSSLATTRRVEDRVHRQCLDVSVSLLVSRLCHRRSCEARNNGTCPRVLRFRPNVESARRHSTSGAWLASWHGRAARARIFDTSILRISYPYLIPTCTGWRGAYRITHGKSLRVYPQANGMMILYEQSKS